MDCEGDSENTHIGALMAYNPYQQPLRGDVFSILDNHSNQDPFQARSHGQYKTGEGLLTSCLLAHVRTTWGG